MPLTPRRALSTVLLLLATLLVAAPTPAAAAPVGLAGAHWIWFPEGDPRVSVPAGTRYLRTTFTVAAGAVSEAQFVVTGDDTVDVWLNGTPVGGSPRAGDSWHQALYLDLRANLTAGTNTIAVEIHQESNSSSDISFNLELAATYQSPLTLDLTRVGGQPVLYWFDSAALLEDTTDFSTWTPVPGGLSPFTFSPDVAKRFFRLRQ